MQFKVSSMMPDKITSMQQRLQKYATAALAAIDELQQETGGVATRIEADLCDGYGGYGPFMQLMKVFWQANSSSKYAKMRPVSSLLREEPLAVFFALDDARRIEDAINFLRKTSRQLANRGLSSALHLRLNMPPTTFSRVLLQKADDSDQYAYEQTVQAIFAAVNISEEGHFVQKLYDSLRIVAHATETVAKVLAKPEHSPLVRQMLDINQEIYITSLNELEIGKSLNAERLTELERHLIETALPLSLRAKLDVKRFNENRLSRNLMLFVSDNDHQKPARFIKHLRLASQHFRVYEYLRYLRDTEGLSSLFGKDWAKVEQKIQHSDFHAFPVDEHLLQVARACDFLLELAEVMKSTNNLEASCAPSSREIKKMRLQRFGALLFSGSRIEELQAYAKSQPFIFLQKLPTIFSARIESVTLEYLHAVKENNLEQVNYMRDSEELTHNLYNLLNSYLLVAEGIDFNKPNTAINLLLASLFHDLAKGDTAVQHEAHSAEYVERLSKILELSATDSNAISQLTLLHNLFYTLDQKRDLTDSPVIRLFASMIDNPGALLAITVADRLGGKFKELTPPSLQKLIIQASQIFVSKRAYNTRGKLLREKIARIVHEKLSSLPDETDKQTILAIILADLDRFFGSMGPEYESARADVPQAAWADFSAFRSSNRPKQAHQVSAHIQLESSADSKPKVTIYGQDFVGLARGLDLWLSRHHLVPESIRLFTGKDGKVIDDFVFDKKALSKLKTLVSDMGQTSVIDLNPDASFSETPDRVICAGNPILYPADGRTIIVIPLKGTNNYSYWQDLKLLLRGRSFNISYGSYALVPSREMISIETIERIKSKHNCKIDLIGRLTSYGLLINHGEVNGSYLAESSLRLGDDIPPAVQKELLEYLREITLPHTVIELVVELIVDNKKNEPDLAALSNDLIALGQPRPK